MTLFRDNSVNVYKGDNTNAFGMRLLRINIVNPRNKAIPRVDLIIGEITKTFNNPTFPLYVNLTEYETKLLKSGSNQVALIAYDENYKPHTCPSKAYVNVSQLRRTYKNDK